MAYRDAVGAALGRTAPVLAAELNVRLQAERLRPGRGMVRADDRLVWTMPLTGVPDGAIIVVDGVPRLVLGDTTYRFTFDGWTDPRPRPVPGAAHVLTPPTSVAALVHGYVPVLHPSASISR